MTAPIALTTFTTLATLTPAVRYLVDVLVAACAAVFLSTTQAQAAGDGLHFSFGRSERVVGSGDPQKQARAVTGFQGIAVRAPMKVVLRQGAREGVEISADDNLLALIETEVVERGGVPTLELRVKKGTSLAPRSEVVATVDAITLQALSIAGSAEVNADALKAGALAIVISGSGKVRLRQLAADDLSAKISGSGDLDFAGRTHKLAVSISGSGELNARGLEADDVSISVAGNGDANVTARKTLDISIAGNGNVTYAGEATPKTSIAGRGNVRRQP